MHQDEVAVGTHLGTVGRRSEAFHNPVGGFLVSLIRQISTQLVKGGRRAGSCRSIARFIRDIGSIEIPVGNQVFRKILVVEDKVADYIIRLPKAEQMLMPMVAAVPLQLIAYYTAVLKGNDVDKPRNLAKSVTVE